MGYRYLFKYIYIYIYVCFLCNILVLGQLRLLVFFSPYL